MLPKTRNQFHVLPKGFKRIRYYGVQATKTSEKVKGLIQEALSKVKGIVKGAIKIIPTLTYRQRYEQSLGLDPLICKHCQHEMGVWKIWPQYVIYTQSIMEEIGMAISGPLSKEAITIGTSVEERKLLVRMLRVMYPHSRFPDGPYERTADAVIAAGNMTPGQALTFAAGLRELQAASFGDLDDATATTYLEGIAGSPFFALVHGSAVVALYNDHEVWELLGYEGPSFDKGGYLNRGFNDLDWLPDPRITELDRR